MSLVTINRTTAADPVFVALITELDADLWSRYQPYQAKYDGFNKVDTTARVVIAFLDQQPVGCACFRPMADDEAVEIKRMFVRPEARGRGIALAMLNALETWASEDGFPVARLETGNKQPEAVGLYEKAGYSRIANYPPYVGFETSMCMEKLLIP